MTEQELQALLSILARAPLSAAEALWLNELIARIKPQPQPKQDTKGV